MRFFSLFSFFLILMFVILTSNCDNPPENETEEGISSRSYKGHQSDLDANNFVIAFRGKTGSRLDDCILCHTGGYKDSSSTVMNACDYCHYTMEKNLPFSASLNSFGRDYLLNGRTSKALLNISSVDSDSDGYTNEQEIDLLYFPGNKQSNPGKPACPYKSISLESIKSIPSHTEFFLSNTHKQQFDDYVTYTGVTIINLLLSLGIDTTGLSGITVFAPDGFTKSFNKEMIIKTYPKSIFYSGLNDAALGQGKGFVNYPDTIPYPKLANGDTIPDTQLMLLAYQRDFVNMPISYIDSIDWRIQGEGPFRLVRPQAIVSPPDRGSKYSQNDQYDCNNNFDHNAGDNVRGVTVIRLDPMPLNYEEYDALNAGWSAIEQKCIVIYGHGITK